MHFKIFLQQLKRGGKRTALYILLLTAVTAFFVMSVNLYRNSTQNLASLNDTYSTIVVTELYGDVNSYGELVGVDSNDYLGYQSVAVKGYDFSEIVSADSVIKWDLRGKYGAYIEGQVAKTMDQQILVGQDVIRFRIKGDEPVELPIAWKVGDSFDPVILNLEVLDSAAGCYKYSGLFDFDGILMYMERQFLESHTDDSDWCDKIKEYYANDVERLNRSNETDKVILYPGVEYVVTTAMFGNWLPTAEPGVFQYGQFNRNPSFFPSHLNYGQENYYIYYYLSSESVQSFSGSEAGQPFPIQRWEDVKNDAELAAYFEGAKEALAIQACTYTVTLTDNIMGIPAYHLGGAYLKEGRSITEEEYENGANVCMIGERLAAQQGWKVGDKLNMSLFQFDVFHNSNNEWITSQPYWTKNTEGFFDWGEYEIVGIYAQTPVTGNSGIARSTLTMAWDDIYIPHNAVENTTPDEELPVHAALLTIWLENGTIDSFLDDMEELGITEVKEGQYNPTFTFFDQGYSLVQPGLEAMHGTAALLLALSSVLMVVTCLLLAYFFAQSQKQSVGIFRMLGGSKGRSILALLACALVVAASGATLGALAGHVLTERVGGEIMATSLTRSEEAGAFQAFVLDAGQEKEPLSVSPDAALTALGAILALALPVALILCFVLLYIHKEPRALLPKGEN